MIAAPARMKSRLFIAASLCLSRAEDGGEYACIGGATAEIAPERLLHLIKGRMRCLAEQRLGSHDHSIRAIAALSRLLRHEGGLYRIRFLRRSKSLDRRDRMSFGLLYGSRAGARGFAVDQHGACSALPKTTTELRPVQAERISKHVQERLRGIP